MHKTYNSSKLYANESIEAETSLEIDVCTLFMSTIHTDRWSSDT